MSADASRSLDLTCVAPLCSAQAIRHGPSARRLGSNFQGVARVPVFATRWEVLGADSRRLSIVSSLYRRLCMWKARGGPCLPSPAAVGGDIDARGMLVVWQDLEMQPRVLLLLVEGSERGV